MHHQGKGYGVVELDGHCWMAEDLASHQFLNGDSIPMGLRTKTGMQPPAVPPNKLAMRCCTIGTR